MKRILITLAAMIALVGGSAGVASAALPGAVPPPVFRPPVHLCPAHHHGHLPPVCRHIHLARYLNEDLGNVAPVYFDPLTFSWIYYGEALYVNNNVLSQGIYPVIYTECTDFLTINGCGQSGRTNHSDTNFSWIQVTGNYYHLVLDSNGLYCVSFAASTPHTPLVIDTCQDVTWQEFYWGGCHQGIRLRFNGLFGWYQGSTDKPFGLNNAQNATPMDWTSGYAGCQSKTAP